MQKKKKSNPTLLKRVQPVRTSLKLDSREPCPCHLHAGTHFPSVFTLELRRQGLLVLLVLERHRLGPPQLLVHLVRYHAAVEHPADHREHQEALEDPPLPPGADPVPHVGPAPLPAVCATKPRLDCSKLPTSLPTSR